MKSGFCVQRDLTGALCVLLLLCGLSWPTSADDAKPLTAILLVARAELPDSDFADSVVLVMNKGRNSCSKPRFTLSLPVSRARAMVEGLLLNTC